MLPALPAMGQEGEIPAKSGLGPTDAGEDRGQNGPPGPIKDGGEGRGKDGQKDSRRRGRTSEEMAALLHEDRERKRKVKRKKLGFQRPFNIFRR